MSDDHGVDAGAGAGDAGDKGGADKGGQQASQSGQQGGTQQQQAKGGQQSQQAAQPYKPDGLADHLFGKDDRGTIDNLMKENKGFRDAQAKGRPNVPDKPDAYAFNWSDKVKGVGGVDQNDKVLGEFRRIAHEHGYTQAQVDAIPKIFDYMVDQGLIEKPLDTAELLRGLAPEGFRGSPDELERRGGARLLTAETWINQLTPQQGFDDGMKTEMRLLTTSKSGIQVIETLMKAGINPSVSAGGEKAAGISKQDLDARVADPRNSTFAPEYNEAFAQETRELFKKMYPG